MAILTIIIANGHAEVHCVQDTRLGTTDINPILGRMLKTHSKLSESPVGGGRMKGDKPGHTWYCTKLPAMRHEL